MAARRGQQPAFWLSIVGISALTPTLINLAADRLGHLPGFSGFVDLANYNTRRNG
jgi:hypothetical protein